MAHPCRRVCKWSLGRGLEGTQLKDERPLKGLKLTSYCQVERIKVKLKGEKPLRELKRTDLLQSILMLRTIIFDLDGVLIDSEPLMRSAFEVSYRSVIGEGTPPVEDYLEHMGESFPNIMNRLGLPHTLWQPYHEFCQRHLDEITLFPNSLDVLEWARARGFKLGLLTGKDRLRTLQILDHFGLQHYFQVVVASDQLIHPKPHPEGIMCVLKSLASEPEQAVMIGDAVNDIVAAQQASVRAIAVTWGIKPDRVLSLCQPDFIVHDWESLLRVLEKLSTNEIGHEECLAIKEQSR